MSPTTVHDPCGAVVALPEVGVAPRATLAGARLGVLDNGKPHALLLMTEMAQRLADRTGAVVTTVVAKRTAAEAADVATIDDLAAAADVVLTGTADCGSCTSWSIYDVHQLEAAGVLAIGVTTTAFEAISREVGRSLGRTGTRLAVVRHPIGGIDEAAVRELAAASVESLVHLATT